MGTPRARSLRLRWFPSRQPPRTRSAGAW